MANRGWKECPDKMGYPVHRGRTERLTTRGFVMPMTHRATASAMIPRGRHTSDLPITRKHRLKVIIRKITNGRTLKGLTVYPENPVRTERPTIRG